MINYKLYEVDNLKIGKCRNIDGNIICRRGEDSYIIDGEEYSYNDILKKLDIKKSENIVVKKSEETAHKAKSLLAVMVEPPARIINSFIIKDLKHLRIIKITAIVKKLVVYTAESQLIGNKYVPDQPWNIDWDTTVSNGKDYIKASAEEFKDVEISCPLCNNKYSKFTSFINHILSEHSVHKVKKKVEVKEEKEEEDDNKCPYCDKVLKSKFGKTNHIKSAHPDKVDA